MNHFEVLPEKFTTDMTRPKDDQLKDGESTLPVLSHVNALYWRVHSRTV
jgi:hypothetical protein